MEYKFTSEPIIPCRVDRRSNKQKSIAQQSQEKRRNQIEEIFSVEQLVKMGHYSQIDKPKPYGIEVWTRECVLRDESSHYEWYEKKIPTLALCLPWMERLQIVERLNPSFWEDSETFYWGFRQASPRVVVYCILDLLNRLIDLPHWEKVNFIPLRWRLGNERVLATAHKYVEQINSCTLELKPPSIPVGTNESIMTLRHQYTPYDYEWQTGKRDHDSAKAYWNEQINRAKLINSNVTKSS